MKKKKTKYSKNKPNPKTHPNRVKRLNLRDKQKKALKRIEKNILKQPSSKKDKLKPKKIKIQKLTNNPLFNNFLNWEGDKHTIDGMLSKIKDSFENESDKEIVNKKIKDIDSNYLDNLSSFQIVFKRYVLQTIDGQDISDEFLVWLNNAYNYLEETVENYRDDEYREVSISSADGKWFEAIVCYNFIMTFNFFGSAIMKHCPVCKSFFCHKGKYARYCSESCKESGMKK